MVALGYSSWDKFKNVIEKARISCNNSGSLEAEHFSLFGKTLSLPNGATNYIKDYNYMLTRYACYLIAQNGSPRKKTDCLSSNLFCGKNKAARVNRGAI